MRLSDKALSITFSQAVQSVTRVASTAFLAHLLTLSAFGVYGETNLTFGYLLALCLFGLPESLLYFVPREKDRERRSRTAWQTILLITCIGFLYTAVLYVAAPALARFVGNAEVTGLLRIICFAAPAMMITMAVGPFFLAIDKVIRGVYLSIVTSLLRAGAVVLAAWLWGDIRTIFIATLIAEWICAVAGLVLAARSLGFPGGFTPSILREQANYSFPLWLAGLAGRLGRQLDRVLVTYFFSESIFALYRVGGIQVPFISSIGAGVAAVTLPRLSELAAKGDREGVFRLWITSGRKTAFAILPIWGGLMAIASDLIPAVFSDDYAHSALVFRIYMLILPLRVANYAVILKALNRTRWILLATILMLVSNAVIGVAMIKLLGWYGAAIGSVGGVYVGVGMNMFMTRRMLKVKGFFTRFVKTLAPLLLLTIASIVLAIGAGLAFDTGRWLHIGIVLSFFVVFYLAIGRLVKAFHADDVDYMRARIGRVIPWVAPRRPKP